MGEENKQAKTGKASVLGQAAACGAAAFVVIGPHILIDSSEEAERDVESLAGVFADRAVAECGEELIWLSSPHEEMKDTFRVMAVTSGPVRLVAPMKARSQLEFAQENNITFAQTFQLFQTEPLMQEFTATIDGIQTVLYGGEDPLLIYIGVGDIENMLDHIEDIGHVPDGVTIMTRENIEGQKDAKLHFETVSSDTSNFTPSWNANLELTLPPRPCTGKPAQETVTASPANRPNP